MIDDRFVKHFLSWILNLSQNLMSELARYQSSIELVQQLRIDTLQRIRNFIAMQTRIRFERLNPEYFRKNFCHSALRSRNSHMQVGDSCMTFFV